MTVEDQNNKVLARVLATKMGIPATMHFDHPDDVCDYVLGLTKAYESELTIFRTMEIDLPYSIRMLEIGGHRTRNLQSCVDKLKNLRMVT